MTQSSRFAFTALVALVFVTLASAAQAEPAGKAAALIKHLRMERIPAEGAWFAATWRSSDVLSARAVPARYRGVPHAAGSAIYALVTVADFSALHRLETDETWHYYGGDPLELLLLHPDGRGETVSLGPDVIAGQQPQFTVPRGTWQGARTVGKGRDAYTFFGDTLVPGFEYQDFTIGYRDELQKQYPAFAAQIAGLTRAEFAVKPVNAMTDGAPAVAATPGRTSPSIVFTPADVAAIDAGPGTVLRELIGRNARVKTSDYSVALFTLAKGQAMPASHNKVAEEVFLVSSGQGEVTLGGTAKKIAAGSIVVIEPRVRHSIKAAADAPLTFYAISFPAFSDDDYVVEK